MRSSGPVSTVTFGTALDALDVLDRDRVHHVDVAGQQRGDARGIRLDGLEDHLVEVVLRLAPPVGVRLEHGLHAGLVARRCMKGPVPLALSANGLSEVAVAGCACVAPFASAHFLEKMYQVSHSALQDRIGRGQHEIDRVVVDLDGLHVGGRARLDLRARAAHALEPRRARRRP